MQVDAGAAEHDKDEQRQPQHAIHLAPAQQQIADLASRGDDAHEGGEYPRCLVGLDQAAGHEAGQILLHEVVRGCFIHAAQLEGREEGDQGEEVE
jgi:hypothetical protein